MAQINNKMEVIVNEIDKTATLFDQSGYNLACRYFNEANIALAELTEVLKAGAIDVNEELLKILLLKGKADYLRTYAVCKFEKWASAHEYPSYLIDDGRRKAFASVEDSLINAATEVIQRFCFSLRSAEHPAMPTDDQFTYYAKTQTLQLNNEFTESLKPIFTKVANELEIETSSRLVALLEELRQIDSKGFDVLQFVKSFIGDRYSPKNAPTIDFDSVLLCCFKYPFRVVPYTEPAEVAESEPEPESEMEPEDDTI